MNKIEFFKMVDNNIRKFRLTCDGAICTDPRIATCPIKDKCDMAFENCRPSTGEYSGHNTIQDFVILERNKFYKKIELLKRLSK